MHKGLCKTGSGIWGAPVCQVLGEAGFAQQVRIALPGDAGRVDVRGDDEVAPVQRST